MQSSVPRCRIREMNQLPVRAERKYILYWMISARRTNWNFSLDRAVEWSCELKKPLLVFEALRCGYRWASERIHRFIIDGMRDNAAAFQGQPVHYYPYVEPSPDAASGLLESLARDACVVVTDDFPTFFLPKMVRIVARRLDVKLEATDTNGLLPMFATDQVFATAHAFRRFLQKHLPDHLTQTPHKSAFARRELPLPIAPAREITRRWPVVDKSLFDGSVHALAKLQIDHSVHVAPDVGGSDAAKVLIKVFLEHKLVKYLDDRNSPAKECTTGLSPYLHFGQISAHEVFDSLMRHEEWSPDRLSTKANGAREGWWGCTPAAEAFLDQLVTWRELGYNFAAHRSDYAEFDSLPDWAKKTLAKHTADKRGQVYTLEEFEQARTHDPLWNAAQRQIVCEGRMQNYLRMLWGKKILEWTASPRDALTTMIELNNKYGLDGRNPNSYSGIFWVLGRYDRPWGPERPIFGTVRYMSSENTARKYNVKPYLAKFGPSTEES